MSRRTKIIIILIILVLVALGLWLFFKQYKNGSEANSPDPSAAQQSGSLEPIFKAITETLGTVSPSSINENVSGPDPVDGFARSFVERYGSYSQESNFENIEDLYSFMTDKMQGRAKELVKNERVGAGKGGGYSGVTTKVLTITSISQSDTQTLLKITTQRKEEKTGLAEPRIYYQDIELLMINVAGEWKVDQANWK